MKLTNCPAALFSLLCNLKMSALFLLGFGAPLLFSLFAPGAPLGVGFSLLAAESEFVAVSELRRGLRLTGKTRMANNEMVEFDLKVLSVSYNSSPGEDLLWAEITTPLFFESGLIAGMSGSPVYYQGRLVGAVAYGHSFNKKPIAGITPIHQMLRVLKNATTDRLPSGRRSQLGKQENFTAPALAFPSAVQLVPVATPVFVGGAFKLQEKALSRVFRKVKNPLFLPGPSTAATTASAIARPGEAPAPQGSVQPGDLIGVNLVRGDLNMNALGTVTYVSNELLLAFGHPMALGSKTELSAYTAFVDAIIPNYVTSFKMGHVISELGVLTRDGPHAVVIQEGLEAKRVPVSLELQRGTTRKNFNFEVVRDKAYFANLLGAILFSSFYYYQEPSKKVNLSYRVTIKTDYEDKELLLKNTVFGADFLSQKLALAYNEVYSTLKLLENNSFAELGIKAVNVSLSQLPALSYVVLSSIEGFPKKAAAGETVRFRANLKPYRAAQYSLPLSFTLPKDLPPGHYQLFVSSDAVRLLSAFQLAPEKFAPWNLSQLFELLNDNQSQPNALSVWMFSPSSALKVGKNTYNSLPAAKRALLQKSSSSQPLSSYELLHEETLLPAPVAIEGVQAFNLLVTAPN